jgi:predicted ArsR family transcriptional regulator
MQKKRKFIELRELILSSLSKGRKTVNQLAQETGINWKTVDNHLVYLVGRGMASVVYSSPYVKIFELSEDGKKYFEIKSGQPQARKTAGVRKR